MAVAIPFERVFQNASGVPVSGVKVYVYAPSSTTPRTAYSDTGLSVPIANPFIGDSAGYVAFYLSSELNYRVVAKSGDDAITYYDQEIPSNISGSQPVDATLTALAAAGFEDRKVPVGTGVDTVANQTLSEATQRISVLDLGVTGDGTTDDSAALTAALAAYTDRVLYFPKGTYKLSSAVAGNGSQIVEYETGVSFTTNTLTGVVSFAYHHDQTYSMRIRRSVTAPTGLMSTVLNVTSGKGDNTTFIGVAGTYTQVRDEPDVTASTKGVLYGHAVSVVPIEARNNIPYDDVAGVIVQNDTSVSGANGTDAFYVGRNSTAFPGESREWVTGVTVGANVGYGFRASQAYFTGFNASGKMSGTAGLSFAFHADPTVQSSVTTTADIFSSLVGTQAASFTLPTLRHFHASQTTIGAGSTVTTQVGFSVSSSLTGATNNYGFRGQIASGSNRWNLYMDGTAGNWLAGELLVSGAATSVTPSSGVSPRLQVAGTTAATSSMLLERFTNDANGPAITLAKSRSTTIGGDTVVQSGDNLGTIRFDGNDGDQEILAASIAAVVDGTPSNNDMPGRLVFSTTRDGASAVTEAMRIDAGQNVIVGDGGLTNAATDGFFYLPTTTSAAPTGVPATYTGRCPMVVDETNSRLYIRMGGTWKSVTLT